MHTRELLIDTLTHLAPAKTLEGLKAADAERRVSGVNHSVAELVAHMTFWARWFCDRCDGIHAPMVTRAAEGWPAVTPGSWPEIECQFRDVLERAARIGDDPQRTAALITPPIEFPPLASYTVHDAMEHTAVHTAHHLGQVVVLRQLMGLWPPPAGSWTW
jgi:uncharacterized damage-inducible protein DinB